MDKGGRTGRGADGKPGRRYELTDDVWERIAPLLPARGHGRKWADYRTVLNGMFYAPRWARAGR